MGTDILTEEQLNNLVRVVAQDFQLKYEALNQIKKRESELLLIGQRVLRRDRCAVCLRTFYFFRRSFQCSQCLRLVCGNCYRHPICAFCIEQRQIRYMRKVWNILCPFKDGDFGRAKFECNDQMENPEILRSQKDWMLRAKIELHINHYLNARIDCADIRLITASSDLEAARHMLITSLEQFDSSAPFIFIDDALADIQDHVNLKTVKRYPIKSSNCGYFHLLSNAVIAFMVSKSIERSRQSSSGLVTPALSITDGRGNTRIPRICAPSLLKPVVNRTESAPTDSPSSIRSFDRNWFMRQRSSLVGSVRSQRSSIIRTPITTPQFLFPPADSHSQCSDLSVCESTDFASELCVRMICREIRAHTGEFITITCVVHSDDLDMDVKWYMGDKIISNGGRYRTVRRGFEYCLEVFDCELTDEGDVVCVVVNNTNISSDTTFLTVYEQDIAGEEPEFIEPLTFEEKDGTVTLKCSVIGYPIPYVTFHRKNRQISADCNIVSYHNGDKWTLKINKCGVDDEGKYVAIARNRIGRTLSHCTVTITAKRPDSYISDV